MNKQEFLAQLRKGLSRLPQRDIEEHLTFYSEMIEDRMEEGLSEAEAVAAVGPVEEILAQITVDIPPAKSQEESGRTKRRLKAGEIVLLALGSPIWLSLGIAAVAVAFSLYVSMWSVIISFWAVFGSLAGVSFGCVIVGTVFLCLGKTPVGVAMIAAAMICAGLSIFAFYGCKEATKGILTLTKKVAVGIRNCFVKKEEAV